MSSTITLVLLALQKRELETLILLLFLQYLGTILNLWQHLFQRKVLACILWSYVHYNSKKFKWSVSSSLDRNLFSKQVVLSIVVVGQWSIIIESWSKSSSDATIDYRYAFFIIDCRGKIKNLLVTNKSIKINKNVRLCELSFSWTSNF